MNSNYRNLTSEMTRDRLVVGIQDGALTEKLHGFNAYFRTSKTNDTPARSCPCVQQQVLKKDSLAPMIDEMKVTPTVISREWKRGQQSSCMRYGRG